MSTYLLPARTLVDPVASVPKAVSTHRWVWPLTLLVLASVAAGVAFALRWDAAPEVIRELQSGGELGGMTEQDVLDKVRVAGRTRLVAGVAQGLFLMPLLVLLVAVALKFTGWLLGTPGKFKSLFTAASVGFLPLALSKLILALALLRQGPLSAKQAEELLASHLGVFLDVGPKFARAVSAVDFFALWGVALLGLGFSEATGMKKGRAMLLVVVLYALYVGVFLVGIPGVKS
jgi:hypothetical protein